jgi:hypothetical protein
MQTKWLVRYGVIPEVARFVAQDVAGLERDLQVVVESPRGLEIGTILQIVPASTKPANGSDADTDNATDLRIVRTATAEDAATDRELREECQIGYSEWWSRIQDWQLDLELVDLEWTLDRQKLILYVLTSRGPETTKLALFAATAGYTAVEVQPVSKDGLVPLPPAGGGCGSGGCGEGGCGH